MIIFDLDGTLADCEHRRHFVSITHALRKGYLPAIETYGYLCTDKQRGNIYHPETKEKWKPDWKSFYEACDKDAPIEPVIEILEYLKRDTYGYSIPEIQIWTGRCESVRRKTEWWLNNHVTSMSWNDSRLKMRPIGDNTSDHELKERWLNEQCADLMDMGMYGKIPKRHNINFVFDSDPKSISMYRRRGIFVFNCYQHDGEF